MEFNGTLNANEICGALFNMLMSPQIVFADNIDDVYDEYMGVNRVEGGLYGDSKLYYATDVLDSEDWLNDEEATNLLNIKRPDAPKVQKITINIFRQISITTDQYLTKRAWMGESSFGQFTSVTLGWIKDTQKIHNTTRYNAFVGTDAPVKETQNITINLPNGAGDAEANNRLEAQLIGKTIADLMDKLSDPNRDFNDYGFMRSVSRGKICVLWNTEYLNKLTYVDLPTIFHKDVIPQLTKYRMPAKYFGNVNKSGGTTGSGNKTIRSLIEKKYGGKNYFPGELLPDSTKYEANETYTVDATKICIITKERSVPFMNAFEVGTSFFNPKSLTENHYLTWGYNELEHLKNNPFIVLKGVKG